MRFLAAVALLAGCAAPLPPAWTGAPYAPGRTTASAAELTALGRALFFDPSLSASGTLSCASCHDPRFAFGPPNALSLQLGGADGRTPGQRAAPSLRYLQTLVPFTEHHHENEGDDSVDAGPTGGRTWDGRASSAHDQARLPLLSPLEMANASAADLGARLRRSPRAARLRADFGAAVLDDPEAALAAVALALEVFQESPADFYPYSSRYDGVLRGEASLTPQEARGLALFNDPAKGNCASCHPSAPTADGAFPLFTDFGHVALGVPRLPGLPPLAAGGAADLGLCGPLRTDFADRAEYCGRFRAPTLRNVALRRSFFHNGVFHDLEEAVRFYALRDLEPARFYPRDGTGAVVRYDDLPPRHHANVETGAPFDRKPGEGPALDEDEIAAVVAFLRTLTDADVASRSFTGR